MKNANLISSMVRACVVVILVAATVVLTASVPGWATDSGSRDWSIVATYPIPEGASGLAWDGTWLYCGIYGADGGRVYQINPSDGSYSLAFTGPHEDAFGLTYDGAYIWTTDHPGSSSDPAIAMQLDGSGGLVSQFNLPDHYMSGICYDAGDFWTATYYPDPATIHKVDGTGSVIKQFTAPDNQPWDLCLENGNLWMADYWGDALYMIDTATGAMLESHPSEGVDPAGIVWDGQYLWYCDNGVDYTNDYLYKIDLSGGGTPVINLPIDTHDYGVVTVGDSVTWNAVVENIGTADLTITGVTISGSTELYCETGLPLVIGPSGQDIVSLAYVPESVAGLEATASVESSDPVSPSVDITLTGSAANPGPDIYLPETTHDYGIVRNNAYTRWMMTIQNVGDETLTIDNITSDDLSFTVDDQVDLPIVLTVLETTEVGIWFHPDMAVPYTAELSIVSNDPDEGTTVVTLEGTGQEQDWPMGEQLWTYQITGGYDNTPKAITAIPDVTGDLIADVIVCSEDNYVRCFNGNSHGTPDLIWEHEISGGSVYSHKGVAIMDDVDEDGYSDVAIGSAWGGRLIRAISGKTGGEIWTHDTHEYGDGGWVYQVDCSYDYNSDGSVDVLAAVGDDASDTGPKRIYCLNGLSGVSIWECPLGGTGFAVIGVEDYTGDGQADVVAGASNADETVGKAFGINGATGAIEWEFVASGSSVWALAQTGDISGDGAKDVLVGDFSMTSGNVYGVETKEGTDQFATSGFGGITGFASLDDVNGDGHPDVVPAHFGTFAKAVDGLTGAIIWSQVVADKPAMTAKITDVSGDGIDDVLVGTLYTSNYCYFLDGVDGEVLHSRDFFTPVDGIAAIPDIVGDGSMEMVVGGRNGTLACYSGGLDALVYICGDIDGNSTIDIADLVYLVDYMFNSGPEPPVMDAANVDGIGEINIADLVYLVDYMFNNGPEPTCP